MTSLASNAPQYHNFSKTLPLHNKAHCHDKEKLHCRELVNSRNCSSNLHGHLIEGLWKCVKCWFHKLSKLFIDRQNIKWEEKLLEQNKRARVLWGNSFASLKSIGNKSNYTNRKRLTALSVSAKKAGRLRFNQVPSIRMESVEFTSNFDAFATVKFVKVSLHCGWVKGRYL